MAACLMWRCDLQSTELSGQISSVAEGINEGEEGEGDAMSPDAKSPVPSRRVTDDWESNHLGIVTCSVSRM